MIDFVLGIVVGAAFSPFWLKVWDWVKEQYRSLKASQPKE
jgi:hypothetical protein